MFDNVDLNKPLRSAVRRNQVPHCKQAQQIEVDGSGP